MCLPSRRLSSTSSTIDERIMQFAYTFACFTLILSIPPMEWLFIISYQKAGEH